MIAPLSKPERISYNKVMFIVGMLSWWYGIGWRRQVGQIRQRIARAVDYFSIEQLISTLFAPFRQISAGKVSGPLGVKWRAFVDRMVSRVIGAFVRLIIIIIGSIALLGYVIVGGLCLLVWPLVPILPIVGFLLFISGWTPIVWN